MKMFGGKGQVLVILGNKLGEGGKKKKKLIGGLQKTTRGEVAGKEKSGYQSFFFLCSFPPYLFRVFLLTFFLRPKTEFGTVTDRPSTRPRDDSVLLLRIVHCSPQYRRNLNCCRRQGCSFLCGNTYTNDLMSV
jgi:hypothetical protein